MQKGDSTFRIIHDGTHGVHVNNETQPRDQIRMPGPAEERRLMQHASSFGTVHFFALQADVRKAHRRFLNRRSDWGLQTCRIRSPHLWVNRVGTFGVGTACYWWAHLAAIVGRVGWMFFDRQELWELLFADDIKLIATGPTLYDDIILKLFLWVLVGTPISWKKCRGGFAMDWTGYWLDYGTYSTGFSESRAMWLILRATELIDRGATVVRQFPEGLGRLNFATGVLEWDRPFLGILYAWGASVPLGAFLKLPAAVTLTFEYIRERLISGKRITYAVQDTDGEPGRGLPQRREGHRRLRRPGELGVQRRLHARRGQVVLGQDRPGHGADHFLPGDRPESGRLVGAPHCPHVLGRLHLR